MKQLNAEEVIRVFSLPNKINLGIKDTGDWSLHNITESNHTIFIGGLGSGKTVSAVSSAFSFLKGNNDGLLIFCDFYKKETEFESISSSRKIMLNNLENGIISGINFVYNEMLMRKKIIRQSPSSNFMNCEVKLSPILFIIDDFCGIQNKLEWEKLNSIDNTLANKLKMILKDGSNCGITVFLIGQNYSEIVFPNSLAKLIKHKRIFRLNIENSELFKINHILNNPNLYLNLSSETKGRSVDEFHLYQFLYLKKAFMESNLKADSLDAVNILSNIKDITKYNLINKIDKDSENSFFKGKNSNDFVFDK